MGVFGNMRNKHLILFLNSFKDDVILIDSPFDFSVLEIRFKAHWSYFHYFCRPIQNKIITADALLKEKLGLR